MKFKPHHVALTVKSLKESIQWYCEKFGFVLEHKYHNDPWHFAILKLDSFRLELFDFHDKTKSLPDYRKNPMDDIHTIGTKHISFEVEDITQAVKTLKEKRVKFLSEVDIAGYGGKFIFLKDCNGIIIELYEK